MNIRNVWKSLLERFFLVRHLISFSFIIACHYGLAQSTIHSKAIRILDGDTFEILLNQKTSYKVRLTDIDAPEKKQDFGYVAKQKLASYIMGKEVKVIYDKLDRNKRILGHVYYQHQSINLRMVSEGFAWHFKKYSTAPRFAQAEQRVRQLKKGLWVQPHPIAPWDFRVRK